MDQRKKRSLTREEVAAYLVYMKEKLQSELEEKKRNLQRTKDSLKVLDERRDLNETAKNEKRAKLSKEIEKCQAEIAAVTRDLKEALAGKIASEVYGERTGIISFLDEKEGNMLVYSSDMDEELALTDPQTAAELAEKKAEKKRTDDEIKSEKEKKMQIQVAITKLKEEHSLLISDINKVKQLLEDKAFSPDEDILFQSRIPNSSFSQKRKLLMDISKVESMFKTYDPRQKDFVKKIKVMDLNQLMDHLGDLQKIRYRLKKVYEQQLPSFTKEYEKAYKEEEKRNILNPFETTHPRRSQDLSWEKNQINKLESHLKHNIGLEKTLNFKKTKTRKKLESQFLTQVIYLYNSNPRISLQGCWELVKQEYLRIKSHDSKLFGTKSEFLRYDLCMKGKKFRELEEEIGAHHGLGSNKLDP